jgi:hypothetical protein
VGSASQCRLTEQDHTQAVDGQSRRWGQHPIEGSQDEIMHSLWKDKVGGEVSIAWQAHSMRSHTSFGKRKCEVGSGSHCRLTGEDHTLAVKRQSGRWG